MIHNAALSVVLFRGTQLNFPEGPGELAERPLLYDLHHIVDVLPEVGVVLRLPIDVLASLLAAGPSGAVGSHLGTVLCVVVRELPRAVHLAHMAVVLCSPGAPHEAIVPPAGLRF